MTLERNKNFICSLKKNGNPENLHGQATYLPAPRSSKPLHPLFFVSTTYSKFPYRS